MWNEEQEAFLISLQASEDDPENEITIHFEEIRPQAVMEDPTKFESFHEKADHSDHQEVRLPNNSTRNQRSHSGSFMPSYEN